MKFINVRLAILCTVLAVSLSTTAFASEIRKMGDDELRAPQVPCAQINVPEGNQVAYRAYASGVQVYWWNGTTWGFVVPLANLYADPGFHGKIGRHYGGPTWRSNSGSLVIGRRLASCPVDPGSIAWLLLEADETDGAGIFSDVTYIQRVNTSGGIAPSTPGSYDGEEVSVPYTAEYYFYKKSGR
jgi:hypothetical protein